MIIILYYRNSWWANLLFEIHASRLMWFSHYLTFLGHFAYMTMNVAIVLQPKDWMNDTICEVELLLTRNYFFTKVQNVGLIEALKLKTNYVFGQLTKSYLL
jgi:hypothetical protein